MVADSRNTKVVACLIASMTLGAGLLLWLEPATRGWSPAALLLAEDGTQIESVLIEYCVPGQAVEPADFGCIVFPNGQVEWHPRAAQLRLLFIGTDSDTLDPSQARKLLSILGNVAQGRPGVAEFIRLHPGSDPRLFDLPAQCHALAALLVRKGIVH